MGSSRRPKNSTGRTGHRKAKHAVARGRGERRKVKMTNSSAEIHSGSAFDDFLEEEDLREEVESAAIKRVLAWQFEQEMARQQKT